MIKSIFLAIACFVLCCSAGAQTRTTVTGTIAGTDGVPWAGAQLSGTLISPGGASPSLTPCTNTTAGCGIQQQVPPTTLGTGGVIQGLALWANASILPAGTTYTFTVSTTGVPPPFGTGPQSCTATGVTLAGATQNISASFGSCPKLTNSSSGGACNSSGVVGTVQAAAGGGACQATAIRDTGTQLVHSESSLWPYQGVAVPGILDQAGALGSTEYMSGTLPVVPNGNFEATGASSLDFPTQVLPPPGWYMNSFFDSNMTASYDSTTQYEGAQSLKIVCTVATDMSCFGQQWSSFEVIPGHVYQLQAAIKSDGTATGQVVLVCGQANGTGGSKVILSNATASWLLQTGTITALATDIWADVVLNAATAAAGTTEYDAIRVVDLTAMAAQQLTAGVSSLGAGYGVPAGYGRWESLAWQNVTTAIVATGNMPANGAIVCTTPTANNASAALPGYEACATGATANTTQSVPGPGSHDLFIGTAAHPTNIRMVNYGNLNATALTNTRTWVAISDQTASTLGTNDTPAGNTIGFRFSSVAGDTAYEAVLCNAGVCAATSTGVTAVANTWHRFEFDVYDGVGVAFYIDGVITNFLATDQPTNVAVNSYGNILDNTTATNETMDWAYMYVSTIQ